MTSPSETQGQTMDPIIQRMQEVFERQRQAFLSHPFPTLAERKAKLRRCARCCSATRTGSSRQ